MNNLKSLAFILSVISWFYFSSCSAVKIGPDENEPWIAIHLLHNYNDPQLDTLCRKIPELKKAGINVLIYEVDYSYEFQSHPELRMPGENISRGTAGKLSRICRENDIRLIIEFQCFGHQSWEGATFPLLTKYPQFDLTPGAYPNNKGIYCREWDPMNPQINKIIFSLIDELIDAFKVNAFHVGMDEVFLINDSNAVSTPQKDPAKIFAMVVNELYQHIVKKKNIEMMMWGDRLIDGKKYDYGVWESSVNGTAPAVDLIPKDIIICDWHYELRDRYPSLDLFLHKGFRVIPATWKDATAARAFKKYAESKISKNLIGHLITTWSSNPDSALRIKSLIDISK